jgi:hypothetical protein
VMIGASGNPSSAAISTPEDEEFANESDRAEADVFAGKALRLSNLLAVTALATGFVFGTHDEIDSNVVERVIRPIAMRKSLCAPSSITCTHWKRVRVDNATRAAFLGHRRFDRIRRQVVGPDLMRCTGNNLHSRKDAGFDKAPYRMVCDA